MNDGELRVLEYVRSQIDGVREDIRDMRSELLAVFMRHDASDNERFAELFSRMRPLEIAVDVQKDRDQRETQEEHRKHGYAVARIGAVAAVLGGGGAELLHWLISFFRGGQ